MLSKYTSEGHLQVIIRHWANLKRTVHNGEVEVDGQHLSLSDVVAVSRCGSRPRLTDDADTINGITKSVNTLLECIRDGRPIYGVNTGFGGSADSRTNEMVALQSSLLQLLQSGILTEADIQEKSSQLDSQRPESQAMPPEWVRATMLIRSNSVSRGHSAVSLGSIRAVLQLLCEDITPVVPLRGTISASGDLMPLAYIVGAIQGSPGISVEVGKGSSRRILRAETALQMAGVARVTLGPKEGLGLVNGTAASAGLASLVLYEAHQLAVLSQAVTALTVEALQGSAESFHPFIGEARPHEGQIEAADNILTLLSGSRLAKGLGGPSATEGLVQDRYSLRTASQWIGPQLEDLLLADRQVGIELNSTSDNPLIDTDAKACYSGGNFQAVTITSAMEKTRLALQMLGKLLFAQCGEMIDPSLNNGLPTNLVADDPSLSFTMKGVDINMAAYMSELAYLANPVSSHVQTAEMHNQALNSLAFISARYTMDAAVIVSMMGACCIYVACQALDLRVLQLTFFQILQPIVHGTIKDTFGGTLPQGDINKLSQRVSDEIQRAWQATSRMDLCDRCQKVTDMALPILLGDLTNVVLPSSGSQVYSPLDGIRKWRHEVSSRLEHGYREVLAQFCTAQPTPNYLGAGSKAIYTAVRHDLRVPFHQGFIEHPIAGDTALPETMKGRGKKTVGEWISKIYEALRDGTLHGTILGSFGLETGN